MKKRRVFFQIKLLVIVILSLLVYFPEMLFFQVSFDLKIYVKCWILRYKVDVRERFYFLSQRIQNLYVCHKFRKPPTISRLFYQF